MKEHDGHDPLALADRACHGPFREALTAVDERLRSGILSTLEGSLEAHRDLIESVGLQGDAPEDWGERNERLLEYRKRLSSDVLEAMRSPFRGAGPSARIVSELQDGLSRAVEGARALPASMEHSWPAGALEAKPSDGAGRRLKKIVARLVSAARKVEANRSVPVRAVALHHLDRTLAPAVDSKATTLLEEWAAWERDIELAWIEWGDTALSALVTSELPPTEPKEETGEEETGEEEDDEEEAGERPATPWTTIRGAADALNASLRTLIDACPVDGIVDDLDASLVSAGRVLEADLAVAGSFVFKPERTHRLEPSLTALKKLAPHLEVWDQGVGNRLHLYEALLAILSGATAVQRRLMHRVREEHLAGTAILAEIAEELEALASKLPKRPESREALSDHLTRLDRTVREVIAPADSAIPDSSDMDATLRTRADATVEALLSMVRQAPSALDLHAEAGRLPAVGRKTETRTLALQELARQSFDALRIERIRSSTSGLVRSIEEIRVDVDELPDVFAFAFEAARKELEDGEEGARNRAVGLVEEALLSMAESVRNADRSLGAAVLETQKRLAEEVSEGSLGLLERVAAGRMQAGLLAARSRFAELRAWATERWGPPARAAARSATARWRVLRRLASRGLRKGTEIVGAGPSDGAAAARTLQTMSDAEAILQELPLVYQRLFTLEPIDDPSLLAERGSELADGLDRWRRWKSADGIPLIVRGQPGSGITSFLNVLGVKIEAEGATVERVAIDERIDGEAPLAQRLSEVLGTEPRTSLDELAQAAFDASENGMPDAVIVDDLEHVYLRVPHGTDLVERLLTLMAETEPRVFWIGGITSSAWQLIAAAEPTAVSQVEGLDLRKLSAQGIREAVTLRHRRSGLSLRFEEPDARRRMLRHRLRRLHDRDAYDDLLADDFFDRLEKASARHLRLALFQWLTAADFGQSEGVVMGVPERPDFSVLDSLALTQNFTLKAFLEHRTLTLEEHDRIFRLPRQESYQIFESLQNRRLIDSVTADGDQKPARSEIEEDRRYRVRPLVVGAVISHLRGRNILH